VEVEYEKTSSKSQSEQAEYTVASTAEDVLLSSLDGVSLEMGSVAGGGTMKTYDRCLHHMEKLIESIDQTCFPKDMFLLVSFD